MDHSTRYIFNLTCPTFFSFPLSVVTLVTLFYSGYISVLNQSQTDQVILLAKVMGIEITVETDLSEDDGDDRSVIFSGNVDQSFFPWGC